MVRLHSALVAPGMEREKRELDRTIQAEIREAKRIQVQTGCTWTEALRYAANKEPSDAQET